MEHAAALEVMARLARAAGEAIMSVRRAGFAVERKSDHSPVTAADRLAETIITEGLLDAFPGIPVVAEEACSDGAPPPVAPRFWLVDPLDGTREFAAGRDEFCACIALVEDGFPVLGVLGESARGLVHAGGQGLGAWTEDAEGARRPLAARPPPPDGLVVVDSVSHRDAAATDAFCAALRVREVRRIGSALKFARLAAGEADVSPRLNGTMMEWDVAPGQALLEAAGGAVLDPQGHRLRHGKPGYRQGGFVAWGRRK
ncbi:3'(2'),5'-bisphosphate nucleotidase CysQ [Roseococcus sp. DSY-14]|uniref:3'(2'),5'-bisphosphate nucleotidase CysQ family protein n=1 Tax=Roseococcus sp. DSY-14 TaxID=3369650 RepID=UPI00387B0B38